MPAIPAVQIVPQGKDAAPSAASNNKATDFKALLESSIAGTDISGQGNLKGALPAAKPEADRLVAADPKGALPAAKSEADRLVAADPKGALPAAKSEVDKFVAADPKGSLPAADPASLQALIGKPHEAAHSNLKADSRKEAKPAHTPEAALPSAVPVGIPLPATTEPVKGAKGNADLAGKAPISGNRALPADISASAKSPAAALGAQPADKPAEIAQAGNILPPKAAKTESPSAGKAVGKEPVTQSVNQPQFLPSDMKPVTRLTVAAPVASPAWGHEIGQKIVWMSATDHHVAELHLNPPNLGPMEIKLTVHNDQATIQFVSHHQDVRAALESALPRLREMMMDNGIALGNATVDSGSYQQSAYSQQDRPRQQPAFLSSQPVSMPVRVSRLIGAVDTFA